MEPSTYDAIIHAEHDVFCPVASDKLAFFLEHVPAVRGARILDLAAGNGEILLRLLEQCGGTGRAVETSPLFRATLRAEAASRLPEGGLEISEEEAWTLEFEPESFDVVIAVGPPPLGDLEETLRRTWAMVRTGGCLILGAWHWMDDEPEPEYMDFLGEGPDAYRTHEAIIALAVRESFTPLHIETAGRDEIDRYESLAMGAGERWLRANPGAPEAHTLRERIRSWRDAYLRWGRYELGFGLYLFLK